MSIIVSDEGGGSFTPHPEGPYASICVDVHDLGLMEVTWQGHTKHQRKIDVYFFCGEFKEGDEGPIPLLVRQRFTATLDDRGRLRPFLKSWRGKEFTPEELKAFDVEKLIGAPAFIQISHAEKNGKTYANIDSIMRLPKGMAVPDIPADFKRMKDRPARENGNGHGTKPRELAHAGPGMYGDVPPPDDDDFGEDSDLPF